MVTKRTVKRQAPGTNTPGEELVVEKDPKDMIYDRKKLLSLTGALIHETHERISGDRFRVRDGDRERLAYLRTLRDLIALEATLLKDAKAPLLTGIKTTPFSFLDEDEEDLLPLLRKRKTP